MYNSMVFMSSVNGLVDCIDRLINKTEQAGSEWNDQKFSELRSSMGMLHSGDNALRQSASACEASLSAFWSAASIRV